MAVHHAQRRALEFEGDGAAQAASGDDAFARLDGRAGHTCRAELFGIFLVLRQGRVVHQHAGVVGRDEMRRWIDEAAKG